jgi:hypothetical protein
VKEALALLLEADRVRVLSASAPAALVADVPWNPDAPDDAAALLGPALSGASRLVLVVGLGLLEIAQPELPPLDPPQRRALLLRDADRYFPVADAVAVSWRDGLACATNAGRLAAWTEAFAQHGAVGAITTVVECLARAGASGSWTMPAGPGETGRVVIRAGIVQEVRRIPATDAAASSAGMSADASPAPDLADIARGADAALDAGLDAMLLDDGLSRRFTRARRGRWARSAAALLLAATALGWAADRWRGRQLDATHARLRELTVAAQPALRAEARLARARREAALLDAGAGDAPAVVLARLGALLPPDAFIQRLEWDGTVWRLDGSASSAPKIVPLLDADARLRDVRIIAASSRFIDAGRQRESFSISFRSALPGESRAGR